MDFIARERAMRTMKLRCTNPALALAVYWRALVWRIGILTSRGWAQHIVDRWRDAVTNRPVAFHATEINPAADEFLSDNPHRVGYHGMHVPGSQSTRHLLIILYCSCIIHHNLAKRISFGLFCLLFAQCKTH